VGHYGGSTSQSAFVFYLLYGFRDNLGPVAQWLILLGLILFFLRPKKKDLILLSYPLLLFVIVSTWKAKAVRYLLPFTPFLIIYCGKIVDNLQSLFEKLPTSSFRVNKVFSKNKYLFPIILGIPLLFPQAYKVSRFDISLTQKDTRTQAREWVLEHLPHGSKIALEMYGPPLFNCGYELLYRHTIGNVNLEFLAFREVNFIIISDIMYHRFITNPKDYPKQAKFYRSLDEKTVLIKEFKPRWNEDLIDLHNPTIKIYYLSSLPNYDFPGNFEQYAQQISLTKTQISNWKIQSQVLAISPYSGREKVSRVFVDIVSPQQEESTRIYLANTSFTLNTLNQIHYSGEQSSIVLRPRSKIFIGYEYVFDPQPLFLAVSGPHEKKYLLVDGFSSETLKRKKLNFFYFYRPSPAKNGDEYFQVVTITPHRKKFKFFSQIYGGELRWGNDYLVNPIAQIQDKRGQVVFDLPIFKGKLGSFQGKKKGGAKKSMIIPSLPRNFKVSGGFSFYYDDSLPDKAGGPASFLFPSLFFKDKNNLK